jgi:hypothetical protein
VREPAFGKPGEGGRAHVGVRAVLQVVDQVEQGDRVPVLAADLEDSLHRVVPAAQYLAVGRGQVRSAGRELVQHGLAVRQAVLKREPVDDADRFATLREALNGAIRTRLVTASPAGFRNTA